MAVRLHFRNIAISFSRRVDAALGHALGHPEYRARDLPGDSDDAGKLVLVRRVTRKVREALARAGAVSRSDFQACWPHAPDPNIAQEIASIETLDAQSIGSKMALCSAAAGPVLG